MLMTIVSSNLNWGKEHWKGILEADAKGYYAYLPALFIYNDLNFGFFDYIEKDKYYNSNWYYDYRSGSEGKVINKYYVGTAIAQLPFFLVAHFLSYLSNYDMDGYSKLYAIFINIAALTYLLVGLIYLNLCLKTYNIKEWQKSLTLLAAVFGTNLFYYTVGESGMSHVYSFAWICMFLFYAKQYFLLGRMRYVIIIAVVLGLIVLIRPINGIIVFILPFCAGNFKLFKDGFKRIKSNNFWILLSFIVFFSILFIQFVIYKISTGSFFVYSYQDEGFNFHSPQMINILFSYRKGLFLYTPLLLISLTGGYFLWKNSRFEFYSWFGFFFLITYIFSSWWMWYYGGSFSSRVYTEFIALFMILLAITLNKIEVKAIRHAFVATIFFLISFCQIQTYQYRYYQIHWSDMNKEKYWDVFLRIDKLMH